MDAAGLRLRPEYLLSGLQRHPGYSMQPFFKKNQNLVPYHYSIKTSTTGMNRSLPRSGLVVKLNKSSLFVPICIR